MSGPATQPPYEQLAELVADLGRQNLALRRRVEQREAQLRAGPPLPPFVKPAVVPKKKERGTSRRCGPRRRRSTRPSRCRWPARRTAAAAVAPTARGS